MEDHLKKFTTVVEDQLKSKQKELTGSSVLSRYFLFEEYLCIVVANICSLYNTKSVTEVRVINQLFAHFLQNKMANKYYRGYKPNNKFGSLRAEVINGLIDDDEKKKDDVDFDDDEKKKDDVDVYVDEKQTEIINDLIGTHFLNSVKSDTTQIFTGLLTNITRKAENMLNRFSIDPKMCLEPLAAAKAAAAAETIAKAAAKAETIAKLKALQEETIKNIKADKDKEIQDEKDKATAKSKEDTAKAEEAKAKAEEDNVKLQAEIEKTAKAIKAEEDNLKSIQDEMEKTAEEDAKPAAEEEALPDEAESLQTEEEVAKQAEITKTEAITKAIASYNGFLDSGVIDNLADLKEISVFAKLLEDSRNAIPVITQMRRDNDIANRELRVLVQYLKTQVLLHTRMPNNTTADELVKTNNEALTKTTISKSIKQELNNKLIYNKLSPFNKTEPQNISLYATVGYIKQKAEKMSNGPTKKEINNECDRILQIVDKPTKLIPLNIYNKLKNNSSLLEMSEEMKKYLDDKDKIKIIKIDLSRINETKVAGGNVKYNKRDNNSTKKKRAKCKTRHKLNLSNRKTRHKLKRTKRRRRKH